METLENANEVVIIDNSNFIPELSNNGGHYQYKTYYTRQENDEWILDEWCSSDIGGWCSVTGGWCNNSYDDSKCRGCEPSTIKTEKLEALIKNLEGQKDFEVIIKK